MAKCLWIYKNGESGAGVKIDTNKTNLMAHRILPTYINGQNIKVVNQFAVSADGSTELDVNRHINTHLLFFLKTWKGKYLNTKS